MHFQVVGCSHHQANVEIREQLALPESQVPDFLDAFYQRFDRAEAALLSTCNRTEFYCATADSKSLPSVDQMTRFLAQQCQVSADLIHHDLFALTDRDAIAHLFSVAASLDSMVVGEAQILSQVKRAYQLAGESRSRIPLVHQIFQAAIRVAKKVSNETTIHSNRVSVPSVAIGVLARQIFERLDNKRILVLGAGEMAEETLKYIRDDGGRDIVITNRTLDKAKSLAAKFAGTVGPWENLQDHLAIADLVVSTTGAKRPVVTDAMFETIESRRRQRPMFILDLAVPRDFEFAIADRTNVYLYTLDDLQRECEYNRKSRQSEYPKALQIIDQETDQFLNDLQRRQSGSTIAQLKRQANEQKDLELKRLINRIDGLNPESQQEIEHAFNRLVNKILHPPLKSIQAGKPEERTELLDALKKLFQLED